MCIPASIPPATTLVNIHITPYPECGATSQLTPSNSLLSQWSCSRDSKTGIDVTPLKMIVCPPRPLRDKIHALYHELKHTYYIQVLSSCPLASTALLTTTKGPWSSGLLRELVGLRTGVRTSLTPWGHFPLPDPSWESCHFRLAFFSGEGSTLPPVQYCSEKSVWLDDH